MTRRVALTGGGALLLVAVAASRSRDVARRPTCRRRVVERGTFVDAVQIRGEIKAGRSVTIMAPPDAGELRIVKLVPSGTVVKKGDTLIEFDGTTVVAHGRGKTERAARASKPRSSSPRSESRAKEEESLTAETKARYDVERAKLDYSAKEILSRVEGEQRGLEGRRCAAEAARGLGQVLERPGGRHGEGGRRQRQASEGAVRSRTRRDANCTR